MGFNSAFKGLIYVFSVLCVIKRSDLFHQLTLCVSEFFNHTMEPLGQWIRPSQSLYHYKVQNTDIYIASLPPVEYAVTVRQLIFLWYVTPCYFCRQASTLWRNLQPPVFSLETYSLPSELQASRAVLVLQRRR